MVGTVFCAFLFVLPPAPAWLLFGYHFEFNTPVHAESDRGFDGVELMSSGEDAAYHREKVLNRHNFLRSREAENGFGGGAVFMNRLLYDVELEAYARNYARYLCATGKWEHSQRQAPLRVARGENLYTTSADYSTVPSRNFDSAQIVQKWWEEREYFDWHSSNPSQTAQQRGKLVGHWTQIVRAETSTMGCWIVTGCQCKGGYCGKQNNGRWSTYMACHYDYGNVGYYPYWPLNPNLKYRVPSSVPQSRRQRCGNCPKGFGACGTTVGGGEKRDAYLCVGHWQVRGTLPPADLLQRSIQIRHSTAGVPSWYYMIRNCLTNNGSCPSNSVCWKYENGRALTREPSVLVNQCQCNGFSTSAGIYFERDFCGRYSMVQPYYDADAFLGFSELEEKPIMPDANTANSPAPAAVLADNRTLFAKLRHRHGRTVPAEAVADAEDHFTASLYTPPLMEEAEEAADLIISAKDNMSSIETAAQHGAASGITHLSEQTDLEHSAEGAGQISSAHEVLSSDDALSAPPPPSDDLMFEWRGVTNPLSIAQKSAPSMEAEGSQSADASRTRLQPIHVHKTAQALSLEDNKTSLSDPQVKLSNEDSSTMGPEEVVVEEEPHEQNEETSAQALRLSQQSNQDELRPDDLITAPEGELEDHPAGSAGAPVDIPAVLTDAQNKHMIPLDHPTLSTSPAENIGNSVPEDHGEEGEKFPSVT